MARLHVLRATGPNTYQIVAHEPTPAGNNSAGVAWSLALATSGQARTRMSEGSNPGQISASEKASVEAGTVIEVGFTFYVDPAWSNAERNAALDAEATKLVNERLADLSNELRWFGATRG